MVTLLLFGVSIFLFPLTSSNFVRDTQCLNGSDTMTVPPTPQNIKSIHIQYALMYYVCVVILYICTLWMWPRRLIWHNWENINLQQQSLMIFWTVRASISGSQMFTWSFAVVSVCLHGRGRILWWFCHSEMTTNAQFLLILSNENMIRRLCWRQ